ncbi:MAG: dihydrodipicolinate synthase family protein [Acidobacteriota bacterium]
MWWSQFRESLRGPIVPMPTPFKRDGAVDYAGLRRYTRFLIDNGIRIISPLGSTGEFYTVSEAEHRKIVATVVDEAAGHVIVIAGASHSGTALASRLVAQARREGADAVLICPPYYLYDGEEGVYEHYRTIAEENEIPIVVYSNRDVIRNIELIGRLAEIPNIVGAKEATGNYLLYRNLCLHYGDRLAIIGGGTMGHFLWGQLWGSPAYFGGVANFLPAVEIEFFAAVCAGRLAEATRIVREIEIPFIEVAVRIGWWRSLKAAMDCFGLPGGYSRLPNRTASEVEREEIRTCLERLGLLRGAC